MVKINELKKLGFFLLRHTFLAIIAAFITFFLFSTILKITTFNEEIFWSIGSFNWSVGGFFHFFHFAHVFLAATTSFLAFTHLANNKILAFFFGATLPVFICTLSDVMIPHLGISFLKIHMALHLCLFCNLPIIIWLVFTGLILGWGLSKLHSQKLEAWYEGLHIAHSIVSAMASLAYIVGFGLKTTWIAFSWHPLTIEIMLILLFAVILPCIFSDLLIPKLIVYIWGLEGNVDICCNKSGH